jgi:hypothetical protein
MGFDSSLEKNCSLVYDRRLVQIEKPKRDNNELFEEIMLTLNK